MSKLNTVILTLTLLLSIISTVYLYSATPAQAQTFQPEAAKAAIGPGVFTGVDAPSWYTTFEGVLAVPNEAPLFPYYHGDVEISVSRFGENINPFAVSAQLCQTGETGCTVGSPISGVGFQYMDANGMAYDPIRNAQVDINRVVDGWSLVITYNKFSGTSGTNFRTIWAYAKFSDTVTAGSPADGSTPSNNCPNVLGGWILCPYVTPMPASPGLTPHGGRKTNGFVVTAPAPIILVDSARRITVASVNTIYDLNGETPTATSCTGTDTTCIPLARLTLTFDFNKDTKILVIIKDVKLLLDTKDGNPITEPDCENMGYPEVTIAGADYVPRFADAKSQLPGLACFELLDTEELDQAVSTATSVAGYAHFFDVVIEPDDVLGQTTTKCLDVPTSEPTPILAATAPKVTTSPKVSPYVGDPLYHWDGSPWVAGSSVGVGRPNCQYDVMQAMDQVGPSTQEQHVTSKAFWPVPDWFTVDAKDQSQFFSKLEGTTTTDLAVAPAVVGTSVQWNFLLNGVAPNPATPSADARLQWRSVETLLVTDENTGDLCQLHPTSTFTAYSPTSTEKPVVTISNALTTYPVTVVSYAASTSTYTEDNEPVTTTVSEVSQTPPLLGTSTTALQELTSYTSSGSIVYELIDTTTTGIHCFGNNIIDKEEAYFDNMVFNPWDLFAAVEKPFITFVNYFTDTTGPGKLQSFSTTNCHDSDDAQDCSPSFFLNVPDDSLACYGTQWSLDEASITYQPCWDSYGSFAERVVEVTQTGSSTALESDCLPNVGGLNPGCNPAGPDSGKADIGTLLTRGVDYTLNGCSTLPGLIGSNELNTCSGFTLTGPYGVGGPLEPAKGTIFKIVYSCSKIAGPGGQPCGFAGDNGYGLFGIGGWEWLIVGRTPPALTSDAAAAGIVTQAQLVTGHPVTYGGLDLADQTGASPTIPFVLQRFVVVPSGTADPVTDYQECASAPAGLGSFLGPCPEGARLHLRDDFSTVVPVDGSDILSIGGTRANQVTNLANDFLSATFLPASTSLYAPGAWDSLSPTGAVFSPAEQDCSPSPAAPNGAPTGPCTFPVVGAGVISTYMDVDGTVYGVIYGGNAQDTFWTSEFLLSLATSYPSYPNLAIGFEITGGPGFAAGVFPYPLTEIVPGVTTVLLSINYMSPHPPDITVFKELNTISEIFPEQDQ